MSNRKYDNHLLYARYLGYTNSQLYKLYKVESIKDILKSQNSKDGYRLSPYIEFMLKYREDKLINVMKDPLGKTKFHKLGERDTFIFADEDYYIGIKVNKKILHMADISDAKETNALILPRSETEEQNIIFVKVPDHVEVIKLRIWK